MRGVFWLALGNRLIQFAICHWNIATGRQFLLAYDSHALASYEITPYSKLEILQ